MTRERFQELCDLATDRQLSGADAREFELIVGLHPEWMDEWLDERESIEFLTHGEIPTASANFQATTMARIRADRLRRSAAYWAPGAIAAVAACIGIFALMQAIGQRPGDPTFNNPNAEAALERAATIQIPDLQENLGR